MEKIKLFSDMEYEINNIHQPQDDKVSITVIGINDYRSFREALNSNSLSEILLYTSDRLVGVYEGFTSILPISIKDNESGTMDITITLQKISDLEAKVETLSDTVNKLVLTGLGAI